MKKRDRDKEIDSKERQKENDRGERKRGKGKGEQKIFVEVINEGLSLKSEPAVLGVCVACFKIADTH